jgi:hypothetical protein
LIAILWGAEIMNWRIKGVVQKVLSVLPGGANLNDVLQRTVGDLRNFGRQVNGKVTDWSILMSYLAELGVAVRGARCFEIGTGWFPTLPICFSLAGAGSVVTFDLFRHLSPNLTFRMLPGLQDRLPEIAGASSLSLAELESGYQSLKQADSVDHLLRAARIEYRAPADATATDLPSESVDIVFSNSVLEHVSRDVIETMMRESHRVLRRGGVAVHGVNCGDHYAYFDRGITAINYLTYSERSWRFWNNKILFQNRLRPRDFLELAEAAGLEVVLHRQKPRKELLAALPRLEIAPEFRRYPPEQLCCTSIDFVSRKP